MTQWRMDVISCNGLTRIRQMDGLTIINSEQSMKQSPYLTLLLFCLAIALSRCQVQNCDTTNYIIPYEDLDRAFDAGIGAVRSRDNLVTLIEQPNIDNVKGYLVSLAPFSAPLFVMAGVAFVAFIVSIVQVICFNTCSKECCGNEISSSTYNICCMRMMVFSYLLTAFLIICLSIAAMIVNSDMQQAIDFTSCNTQNIIEQTYNGNDNVTIPWSGINNFQIDIDAFSVNIQNAVPFLSLYFSSSNPDYVQVTETTAGSSYANSQLFTCNPSSVTIACPFPDSAVCTTPYDPVFNVQFCSATFNNSAQNLVNDEMAQNSTNWRENVVTIQSTLGTITTDEAQVNTLVTEITGFTESVGQYETTLLDGFTQADSVINNISIGFYVLYSFIILLGLTSLTSVCCVYYCLSFKCRYLTYFLWYVYAILSVLFFVGAGLALGASIFTFDTCTAYPYYFANQTNFNTLTFANNSQLGGIFDECFFTNSNSMFVAFADTSILSQFGQLEDQYILASPSPSFSSVVSTIEDNLNSYRINPDTVVISGVNDQEQPSVAFAQLQAFGNYSLANTTQSCRATQDHFAFAISDCYPYLINQPAPDNGCVPIFSPNLTTIVNGRVTDFNNLNCTTDANTYQTSVTAMKNYADSIGLMVAALAPFDNSDLQQYENNYFNYYTDVRNFINNEVQASFSSFFDPYNSLQEGSSCGFVTTSMNGIVNIACNQLFPYINVFSSINITCSVFIFVLFLLSYFLSARFQFYEFLQGNYENFGVETKTTRDLQQAYEFDTGRQIQLLSNGDKAY